MNGGTPKSLAEILIGEGLTKLYFEVRGKYPGLTVGQFHEIVRANIAITENLKIGEMPSAQEDYWQGGVVRAHKRVSARRGGTP